MSELAHKDFGNIHNVPVERRRAARAVAAAAHDAEDCRTLLDALGLLDPALRPAATQRRHRR